MVQSGLKCDKSEACLTEAYGFGHEQIHKYTFQMYIFETCTYDYKGKNRNQRIACDVSGGNFSNQTTSVGALPRFEVSQLLSHRDVKYSIEVSM